MQSKKRREKRNKGGGGLVMFLSFDQSLNSSYLVVGGSKKPSLSYYQNYVHLYLYIYHIKETILIINEQMESCQNSHFCSN